MTKTKIRLALRKWLGHPAAMSFTFTLIASLVCAFSTLYLDNRDELVITSGMGLAFLLSSLVIGMLHAIPTALLAVRRIRLATNAD